MENLIQYSIQNQNIWQQKLYSELCHLKTGLLIYYQDYLLILKENSINIEKPVNAQYVITPLNNIPENLFSSSFKYYIGMENASPIYGLVLKEGDFQFLQTEPKSDQNIFSVKIADQSFLACPLKIFLENQTVLLRNLICRAKQLLHWHLTNIYCSACRGNTTFSDIEIAKICQNCKRVIYPHTSPAVLVLVEKDNKILLARSPHFRPKVYSVLAGFVEAGESLEDTLVREVAEEVGIKVKNIRYFGSQSWPFENSFMVAFRADYASGEIKLCPNEIEDAKWFSINNLPPLPFKSSLSRRLIDAFVQDKESSP